MGWKFDEKKQTHVWVPDRTESPKTYTSTGTTGEKLPYGEPDKTTIWHPGSEYDGWVMTPKDSANQSSGLTSTSKGASNASSVSASSGASGASVAASDTSYTNQINQLLGEISGTGAFAYDPNTDSSWQSYLSGMMNSGKDSMEDTMGQAAALTGGYGSSYATAAGQQAYDSMIEQAMANQGTYENAAYNRYQDTLQSKYDLLSAYQNQQSLEADNPYANTAYTENEWNMATYYLQNGGASAAKQYINGLDLTDDEKTQMLAEIGSGVTATSGGSSGGGGGNKRSSFYNNAISIAANYLSEGGAASARSYLSGLISRGIITRQESADILAKIGADVGTSNATPSGATQSGASNTTDTGASTNATYAQYQQYVAGGGKLSYTNWLKDQYR
jgi:hypothetical protein